MGRAKKSYCNSLKNKYIENIEDCKIKIRKNFKDMDINNASIINQLADIEKDMETQCDNIIKKINSYYFE